MKLPNRNGPVLTDPYRYGLNGQEKDDEIKGENNSINYSYRMYDPRIGRFFAVDPISAKYPMLTPYQFSSNNPIGMIEIEGLEGMPAHEVIISPAQFGVPSRIATDNLLLSRVSEINGHTVRVVYPSPGADINGNVIPGRVFTYVFDADAQHWNVYVDNNADGVDDTRSGDLDAPNTTERLALTGTGTLSHFYLLNNVRTPVNTLNVDEQIEIVGRDDVKRTTDGILANAAQVPPNSEVTKMTVFINPDLQYGAAQELKYSIIAEYGSKYEIVFDESGNNSIGTPMTGGAEAYCIELDWEIKATEPAPNIP